MSLWADGELVTRTKINQKELFVGAAEPSEIYDGQLWYDTANTVHKGRRSGAWVSFAYKNVDNAFSVAQTFSADINMGANKVKTTNYDINQGNTLGAAAIEIKHQSANTQAFITTVVDGAQNSFYIAHRGDATNWSQGEFGYSPGSSAIVVQSTKAGSGTLYPIKLIMSGNDIITLNTDNTVNANSRAWSNFSISGSLPATGAFLADGTTDTGGSFCFPDSTGYVLTMASTWGLYWDTTANSFIFRGAGSDRVSIDLDDGSVVMQHAILNTSIGLEIRATNASNTTATAFLDFQVKGTGDYASRIIRNGDTNGTFQFEQTGTGGFHFVNGSVGIGVAPTFPFQVRSSTAGMVSFQKDTGESLTFTLQSNVQTITSTLWNGTTAQTMRFVVWDGDSSETVVDLTGTQVNFFKEITVNPSTTPVDGIVLSIAPIGSAGTRDSHFVHWRGRSDNGTPHTIDWYANVDVTSNAGGSVFLFQSRVDGASAVSRFRIEDAGVMRLYESAGTKNIMFQHDGTNAIVDASSGHLVLGGTSTTVRPYNDNTITLGGSGFRWAGIYSGGVVTLNSTGDIGVDYQEGGANRWQVRYSVSGNYLFIRDSQNSRDMIYVKDDGTMDFNSRSISNALFAGLSSTGRFEISATGIGGDNVINLTGAFNWYGISLQSTEGDTYEYLIGRADATSTRAMSFHIPSYATYSSTGTIPSFIWASSGAVTLMRLYADAGDLWLKGAAQIESHLYMKVVSAPSDPSAGYTRLYAKQIDANNDGLFAKVKRAGAFVEVQVI